MGALEQRWFELRHALVNAGVAGNLLAMNRLHAACVVIDDAPDRRRRARANASKADGIQL